MPERIEVHYFKCTSESKYIHKYYLAKDFYKEITRQDIDALSCFTPWRDEVPSDQAKYMISDGVILFYKDIGCEKVLSGRQVIPLFNAVKAYYADKCGAKLTNEELTAAIAMNERLIKLEEDIKNECIRVESELLLRIEKGDDFLKDYEIDIDINFYMDDKHPAYYEDDVYHDTEILIHLNECIKRLPDEMKKEDYWGIGDKEDHNDKPHRNSEHPLWGVRNCYLFHELESYSPMPLKHVTRIGMIRTDIKVWHQNYIDISSEG